MSEETPEPIEVPDVEKPAVDLVPGDIADLTGEPVESDVMFNAADFLDDDSDDIEMED